MGIILLLFVVILAVGGYYLYTHQGESTTVTNPGIHPPSDVAGQAQHGLDSVIGWVGTPTGGLITAIILIVVFAVGMYKKLSTNQAVVLTIVVGLLLLGASGLLTR